MSIERIMAMEITNEAQYQRYREAMEPLLNKAGGAFGYDFKVSEVLRSKTDAKINRVFTIEFPTMEAMERYFNDPEYLKIKQQYFEGAVGDITVISIHQKDAI